MSSTDQKITIAPLSTPELPACASLLSKSFGHDAPFVDIYFPSHDTPSGQATLAQRLTAWKTSSPESTFLKAVVGKSARQNTEEEDDDDEDYGGGVVAGFAIWTLMESPPAAELERAEGGRENVERVWPEARDREFMGRLWEGYVRPRSRVIGESGGRGVYVLELLAVHPEYQRLGAGTALVSWGTHAADDMGVVSVVEGTPAARRCYEKCGFTVEIEEMEFNVGEEFKGRMKPVLNFLTRGR